MEPVCSPKQHLVRHAAFNPQPGLSWTHQGSTAELVPILEPEKVRLIIFPTHQQLSLTEIRACNYGL